MADENEQVTQDDLYTMSDEEIEQLDFDDIAPDEGANEDEYEEGSDDDDADALEDQNTDDDDSDGEEDESAESDDAADEDADDSGEEDLEEDAGDDEEEASDSEESDSKEDSDVDYKAAYEKLTQPFKANGKEMKVDNVDDAIQLMQMGANYTKKMAALKPNLKLLKMLENNKLLSEEKLGFYIDLENKDPEAIKKLLKDSEVDPMELDLEEESEYRPNKHTVDDRQVDLDMVLDEIKDTPKYSKTIDVVSNKWDGQSKQAIYENPQLLKVINDHVESGVYDVIEAEIEREQTLGRLTGLSDFEAYRQVGDAIEKRGGFNHLFGQQKATKQPVKRKAAKPRNNATEDKKVNQKRRAASPTRTSESLGKKTGDYNPLSLPDDEFEKLIDSRFI